MLRWMLQTVRGAGGCHSLSTLSNATRLFQCHTAMVPARCRLVRSLHALTRSPIRTIFLSQDGVDAGALPEVSLQHKDSSDSMTGQAEAIPAALDLNLNPRLALQDRPHVRSMAKLRAFLSEEQGIPHPYTIRDIRHRYVLWKSDGVLHDLTPMDMSSLICLLGTLSISPSTKPLGLLHTHPRASHMPLSAFVPQWRFLTTVFRDKCYSLRYPLLPSDRYWMMRAHLAGFCERVQSNPQEAEGYLVKAGKLYVRLSAHSHPDIHVPYLQALLASLSTESTRTLTGCFASILVLDRCHPAIVDVLFHAILRSPQLWSSSSRQNILHALEEGVEARAVRHPWTGDTDSSLSTNTEETSIPAARRLGISRLAMSLKGAVFNVGPANGRHAGDSRISDWATNVAGRIFTSDPALEENVDLRWNCLVLLALALTRSTDVTGKSAVGSRDPKQQAAVVEWQSVCILVALENLLRSQGEPGAAPFDGDVLRNVVQVVRNLWRDWTTVPPSVAPPRPLLIARLICASFMKLAYHLKDKALVDACREYTVAAGLWAVDTTKPPSEDGLQELAAEQLYASLVCGTFFERALVDLVVYAPHVHIVRGAVDEAIQRYTRMDPEHAQELVAWASNRNIIPTPTVVATVGVALARHGIGDFLDRYLNDTRLPPELRARVLSTHLRMYVRYGRRFMEPRQVADAMGRAFALLPELESPIHLAAGLQSALLTLIRHQHAKFAARLLEGAVTHHPSLFPLTFYTRLLRALLQHRQYTLARRTLTHGVQNADVASSWTSLVLFRLQRERAHRLASRLEARAQLEETPSFALIRILSRSLHSRRRRESAASTLVSAISSTDDPHAWLYAVNTLARAGRMRAAKQLVHAVRERERATPSVRTPLCNAVLHAYLLSTSASNRQRLRSLVAAYGELADGCDFTPDHVTVNILVKAQLRLRDDVDAAAARRLFDALVRRGYPTGELGGDAPISLPFGTSAVPRILVGGLEVPQVDAPLSFKRHVEPMYKMFVKAFYQRHDVAAARKIIGILKVLEGQDRN